MASDDQARDAAGNGHATGLKPEFRALAERAKELAKREERRKTEQVKADTQRKAESTKAQERRIAESRRQEERKRAERRQESLRKEAERRIENGKAIVEKERARREFSRQADDRNKAQAPAAEQDKRHALAMDMRRRAEAAVAERQQRQKAQQQEEHRRQTDHIRTLHHNEMHSFRDNEDAAIAGHAHEIQSINEREQEALGALATHRESLMGRAVTFFKGGAHYVRQAEAIVDRCETERMATHRDLEALKERRFAAAQQARLRQGQERKGIFELHRMERQQLVQAQERSRGSEIGVSQRAFERAADRKQQTLEMAHGLSRGPSR
jgi:colicin import membrane protein